MEEKYISCNCGSLEHTMKFVWFKDDPDLIYISSFLNMAPWYKRIWQAIKHIFGYTSRFGMVEEYIITPIEAKEIKDVCERYLRAFEGGKYSTRKSTMGEANNNPEQQD